MSETTEIAVVQNAMMHVGLVPIESLADGSEKADTAARLYPAHRSFLLALHPWKFAARRGQLSRETAAPAAEWDYSFILPQDGVLPPHSFWQSADANSPPYKNFEIAGNRVLTDSDELWCAYTAEVPETLWPPYFRNFAEHSFAAIMGAACNVTQAEVDREDRMAWGLPQEGRRGGLFAIARSADGRFAVTRSLIRDGGPLIAARRGGR